MLLVDQSLVNFLSNVGGIVVDNAAFRLSIFGFVMEIFAIDRPSELGDLALKNEKKT